jgi:ABC-type polysaccharide/polyol phosphate transport system ATPase subunit
MARLIGGSNIMALASHSMHLLREWCNRGILLQHGRIVVDGSIDAAIAAYEAAGPSQAAAPSRAAPAA